MSPNDTAMNFILIGLCIVVLIAAGGIVLSLVLIAAPEPKIPPPRDVFGFEAVASQRQSNVPPPLRRFDARDGDALAYRFYDAATDRIVIFIHGSSYHGAAYHALATAIAEAGAAKVALPNLRGHYMSGRRRGDVDYIGQLEDDIADLIASLRAQGLEGPITLGGHSSGGGLAIRFAGGAHRDLVSSFLVLSPLIPASPAVRDGTASGGGTAGGWAVLHMRRLYGLLALNTVGIHGFDGLPNIAFNKPPPYWDGTETLSYSYRLNVSYHPRYRTGADLNGLGERALVLVGANDEAIDGDALRGMIEADAPGARFEMLPGINHFGIFTDQAVLRSIAEWLAHLPAA